jgi:hypothetical protein
VSRLTTRARDSVFIGRDRLDEVMAIEELHVVDGADSPPDLGFQQRDD